VWAEHLSTIFFNFTNPQIHCFTELERIDTKRKKMMQKPDMLIEGINSYDDTELVSMIIPTDKDVLCGRGKTNFLHEGNIKFRQHVGANLEAYINAQTRSQKSALVKAIADYVLKQGGRFLKLEKGVWYDGGVKTAREKVCAIRDENLSAL
jgi:hypothetical protein